MSDQFYPAISSSTLPQTYAPPSRLSVWRIAAAVFVGTFLCFILYLCFLFGVVVLLNSGGR